MRGVIFEKTLFCAFCVKSVVGKIQQINSEFVHSSQFSNQTATTEKKSRQQSEENRRHLMAVCPRPTINLVTKVAASEQLCRYHLKYKLITLIWAQKPFRNITVDYHYLMIKNVIKDGKHDLNIFQPKISPLLLNF